MKAAAETIKRIRRELCLEQSELGELLGMSKQAIWHYEKGTRKPRLSTLRKILGLAKKHKIMVSVKDFY